METNSFSIKERKGLLTNIFQLRKVLEQLSFDIDNAPDDETLRNHLMQEFNTASNELQVFEDKYTNGLPILDVSRCPYSNEVYNLAIDSFGLDGPWWDAEQPVREEKEAIPSFFAITGSVNIIGEPPAAPFTIKPGPAVPWISPRLLSNDDITAVLSHIKIGLYDAYVTVYYTDSQEVDVNRINTWGTNEYLINDNEGFAVLDRTYDDEDEYDFDIANWIKKGKLKWIAINDKTLELQNGIDNCPYLDIKGYKYPVIIQNKTIKNSMITLEYEEEDDAIIPEIEKTANFCSNCGTPVKQGAQFCSNCGYKLT